MLRYYLRNTVLSPAMIVAIIGVYLAMLAGAYPFYSSDLLYNYQHTISLGFVGFFIPVATVLPICYFQHMLTAGRATQFCLMRSRKKAYASAACASAVISGMLVMAAAFVLFTISCLIYSPQGTPYLGKGLFQYSGTFYQSLLSRPLLMYVLMGAVFMLNGAIWPMISLLCFSFTSNKYLVVSIPFILRTVLGYIAQPLQIYALDPAQLLLKGIAIQWTGGGIPFLLLYCGAVTLVCGGIWTFREYRRMRNG